MVHRDLKENLPLPSLDEEYCNNQYLKTQIGRVVWLSTSMDKHMEGYWFWNHCLSGLEEGGQSSAISFKTLERVARVTELFILHDKPCWSDPDQCSVRKKTVGSANQVCAQSTISPHEIVNSLLFMFRKKCPKLTNIKTAVCICAQCYCCYLLTYCWAYYWLIVERLSLPKALWIHVFTDPRTLFTYFEWMWPRQWVIANMVLEAGVGVDNQNCALI